MVSWPGYTPSTDPLHRVAVRHARAYRYTSYCLWGLAILGAVGDIVTTWIGVTALWGGPYDSLYEAVGVTAWVLDTIGMWGLIPQKALGLGFAWGVSRAFPRPYPLGIAVTVACVNGVVTIHNLQTLLAIGAFT